MATRGEFEDLLDKLTGAQLELMAAVVGLAVMLQGTDAATRNWAIDGLARLVNGEGPFGLEIWQDAIEGWE